MFGLSSMKIGTLLGQANLVRPDDLKASVPMAKKMRLPIGRVLVSTGALSDEVLEAALSAQSLIRERLVPAETAIKALKDVKEKGLTFAEALGQYGLRIEHLEFTNRLGQLLVDAEFATSDQRHEALQVALGTGLPLGRVLVFKQILSNASAYAALSAQVLIRANKITREQAIEALKQSNNGSYSFEQALNDAGFGSVFGAQKVMLGQLLVASNLISEIDFLMGLEKSLSEESPLGKVLVELQMLSPLQLERALKLQNKVSENLISVDEAAVFLQQGKVDLPSLSAPMTPPLPTVLPTPVQAANVEEPAPEVEQIPLVDKSLPFGILEILIFGKLISPAQADRVRSAVLETGYRVDYILLEQELINVNTLKGMTRCVACYEDGAITAEESVLAFYTWFSRPDESIENVISLVTQRDFI
jgi:hypothetical protein